MIEVFLLISLITVFLDTLLQTYIHYWVSYTATVFLGTLLQTYIHYWVSYSLLGHPAPDLHPLLGKLQSSWTSCSRPTSTTG
jgi:hypothetical protein